MACLGPCSCEHVVSQKWFASGALVRGTTALLCISMHILAEQRVSCTTNLRISTLVACPCAAPLLLIAWGLWSTERLECRLLAVNVYNCNQGVQKQPLLNSASLHGLCLPQVCCRAAWVLQEGHTAARQ